MSVNDSLEDDVMCSNSNILYLQYDYPILLVTGEHECYKRLSVYNTPCLSESYVIDSGL